MKNTEEDLQHQIENGSHYESSEDARAYRLIFDNLKKEPNFHVSLPFADRIVAMIDKKEERHDYFWIATGIFLIVVTLIVSLAMTDIHWTTGAFTFLSGYSGLIIFGIVFILFLQWIDKRIIKKNVEFH